MGAFKSCILVTSALVLLIGVGIPALAWAQRDNPRLRGLFPFLTPEDTWGYTVDAIPDLTGKTAVVTGANTGLGFQTAKHMALKGANVVLCCRSQKKCDDALNKINALGVKGELHAEVLDLASLQSVREFGDRFLATHSKLHVLMLNAGIMHTPHGFTADGIESHFGVNHVAHFYLTSLLMKTLKASAPATVVPVSSSAHNGCYPGGVRLTEDAINAPEGYTKVGAYGQSKLANLFFAQELASRVVEDGVYVNAVHPGAVFTELSRHWVDVLRPWIGQSGVDFFYSIAGKILWSPENAALTQLYAGTSPDVVEQKLTGGYYVPIARVHTPNEMAANMTQQKALWELTEAMLAARGFTTAWHV